MKTKFGVLILLLAAAVAPAQTNNLTALLQQGLFEEQANRNLDAAIADYQALARQFDKDRQLAATAVFRLGECYRMQGKTNEAALEYQRILRDFSDQATLATLSRQNLTGMGMSSTPVSSTARQRQIELLEKQIALAQQNVATIQERVRLGAAPQAEANTAEQQVLQLQITLAGLNASSAEAASSSPSGDTAEDQEIQRIQTMIQNSPDLINHSSGDDGTPLFSAASKGQLRVADFLIDHGANVNARSGARGKIWGDWTPLIGAVNYGQKAMVELLLSRGADVNLKGDLSGMPLYLAVKNGFQAVAEVLLASNADVNASDASGMTALHEAAVNGNSTMVSLLLEHKADVNVPDHLGNTPLMTAAGNKRPEIVKLLLAAGANPNALNQDGRTPLSFAASIGSPEMVKMLLDAKADPNAGKLDLPLLCAIIKNDVASAELLLQAGAKPDSIGNFNLWRRPGLGGGIGDGSAGGRVGGRAGGFGGSSRPVSPLSLAISESQFPMVQLLLKYKADPNQPEANGQSVLFNALSQTNILKALLDAGADANARMDARSNNRSLLQMAAQFGSPESVALLLQHGANPNATDANGETALHYAAQYLSDEKVFIVLLDHKANPNVRDNDGKTPLDIVKEHSQDTGWDASHFSSLAAQKAQCTKLIALLRQRGALDNLPDWDRIIVSRPSDNYSRMVFQRGTNNWNHFTLLELIFKCYESSYPGNPRFPDLSRVVIVRPDANGAASQRIKINLLDATNGVDCAKDVPLEFGDVVEIPERQHTLADRDDWTGEQIRKIIGYFRAKAGQAQLVVAGGQTAQLPLEYFEPVDCDIGAVLKSSSAQNVLTSGSDLSRVKVTRKDLKTGKTSEWILDCSRINQPNSPPWHNNAPDLWLRDGDVIEVPAK